MFIIHYISLGVIGVSAIIFAVVFLKDVQETRQKYVSTPGLPLTGASFVAAFFDTLGIGGFATVTSFYKFTKLVDDRVIPGTLNVGFCLPVVAQALIFITVVKVEPATFISMMLAATLGAVIGAGGVSKLPVDKIRAGLGRACGRGFDHSGRPPEALPGRRRRVGPGRMEARPVGLVNFILSLLNDHRHRALCAGHSPDLRHGDESPGRLPDHDGLVRPAPALGRNQVRQGKGLSPQSRVRKRALIRKGRERELKGH